MKKDISPILALDTLWQRGDIHGLLFHEGQEHILETVNRLKGSLICLNISRQWGKTFFGVALAVSFAYKKPFARIRIAAAFESDLEEFIIPAFEAVFASCPEHLKPHYHQQKKRFTFKNKATIKLVGLDRKPNGLRGNVIDLIILDEAGFMSRLMYLYEHVIIPLTTHRPEAVILAMSTPPESPDHEFWELCDIAKQEDGYVELTIDQNPLLTRDDVARIEKRMGGRHTTAFRREYLCERIVEEDRAIVPEWKEEYELDELPEDQFRVWWHKYLFLDIGVQIDKTVCTFGYYSIREACLYIVDEVAIHGPKTTTRIIYDQLKEKSKAIGYEEPYRRVSDNSHPLLLNDLSEKGMGFMATDKQKLHEMVGELRVWVRAGRLKVLKSCKQTIGCLRSGIWDKNRKEFDRSKVFGHYDALATLVYAVRNIDQHTNPVPDFAAYPNAWLVTVPHKQALSPLGSQLKQAFTPLKGIK